MGFFLRTFVAVVLLAAGCFGAAAETDISEAVLARAIQAYKDGDTAPAIGGINAAMRGRLSAQSEARAYYYRGLAHRKAEQPGQAISDLTRALDLNQLSEAERSDAKENLQVAYQEAGIGPNEKVLVGKPSTSEVRPSSSGSAAARQPIAATTTTASLADSASAPIAGVTSAPAVSSWPASTTRTPAAKASVPDAPTSATARVDQRVAITQLPPVAAAKKLPLSTAAKPREAAVRTQPAVTPVVFSPFTTEVLATPDPSAVNQEMSLFVGEPGSRSATVELAIRLTSQRGGALGPRRPQVVAGTIGDTVSYRLRLGPFADANQAMSLCRSLRDSGFTCNPE